ncbi:DJ-1/PfpI family protein [Candidatus Gracilibacteria bacterium]|nr:DJ-1/PfpI family protein [Candidatus Gracilibacteria bacterium]
MDIAIVLYPRFTALDAIGPLEVLSSLPGAQVRLVAAEPGPITNDTGLLTVQVETPLTALPKPDIVLVPGGPGCFAVMQHTLTLAWLHTAHKTSRFTTSVCTGSLILGAAGLLQGAPATTHWGSATDLAPFGASYCHERFVRHERIITSAGVSAGIDMALWLIHELSGAPTMAAIQLAIEYDPQPPAPMVAPPTRHEDVSAEHWQVMAHRRAVGSAGSRLVWKISVLVVRARRSRERTTSSMHSLRDIGY